MRVIVPNTIDDSTLTSSTIPEPDSGETVWTPYTSTIGDRRISTVTHRVYEAVVSSTDDPVDGVNKNPPSWVDVKPTNKWAMFDAVNSTQSEEATQLIVEVTAGVVSDSIAGFNIEEVDTINITVTDPVDGEVFNEDVDMNDSSKILDFWEWHFVPIRKRREFAVLNLPYYSDATIKMTADGGDIKFGNLIVGTEIPLGTTILGTGLQLLDFSRKETDIFGNTVVSEGRNSKLVDFDAYVPFEDVSFVFETLSDLTNIPTVWLGTEATDDATLSFGYFRDVQQNLSSHTVTDLTITVESLT